MHSDFVVERRWFPEGEGAGTVPEDTHFLSMADSRGTFIDWSAEGWKGQRRHRAVPGEVWVWPPGQTWWARREAGKTCVQMTLSSGWLRRVADSPAGLLPQTHLRDPLLAQMLRALADTAGSAVPENPTGGLYRESLATALVLHLATHYGETPRRVEDAAAPLPPARLRAISDYVSERMGEKVSLADLADLAGLSPSQFSLRFRATTGQTPHQFVTALRVDRARELLVTGRHAPADVAAMTGFADQSHLTRHVRRILGTTPGALLGKR